MTDHIKTLVGRLADRQARDAARAELIGLGHAATEGLLSALAEEADPWRRRDLLRILLELRDPRAGDAFREALGSDDEELRALGATGLQRLAAPDALRACLATINDAPDMLHYDITPSVRALAEMGVPALRPLLPLLDSDDEPTRQHAQKVLELVTHQRVTKAGAAPHLAAAAEQEWRALWEKNGPYRWDGPEDQRRESLRRWREWLDRVA